MTLQGARAIRSVCVVGGGIVALSAALAFARALPAVRVRLIETAPDPAALADALPGTLPTVNRFHAAIGLDELELVSAGVATHRLGTRFEDWSADGTPWYHVFGSYGRPAGTAPFHQLWLRARRAGEALPFHAYAAAAALARAGKFVHPTSDPASPLSTYLYGLRLDPDLYRERLSRQLDILPVERGKAEVLFVETGPTGVSSLQLAGGARVEADIFLDCAGPSAPLLTALDSSFEAWSGWFPFDRLSIASAPPPAAPSPVDAAVATAKGWRWSAPLRHRTLTLCASAGDGEGGTVRLRPGRRPRPWSGNVLAIGDAAAAPDPLAAANLHLAQNAILRALELLPGRDCHPLELAEYNRRTEQETLRVRDFAALHYLRSGRTDGALWRALAARRPPDSLAHTLDQFEARGRLPFYEEESFDADSWRAVLLGMGVLPRAVAPSAAGVDEPEAAAAMARLAARVAALPSRLPDYGAYLTDIGAKRTTSSRS